MKTSKKKRSETIQFRTLRGQAVEIVFHHFLTLKLNDAMCAQLEEKIEKCIVEREPLYIGTELVQLGAKVVVVLIGRTSAGFVAQVLPPGILKMLVRGAEES